MKASIELRPIHDRHHPIGNYKVGQVSVSGLDCLGAVAGGDDMVAPCAQEQLKHE
ncbi:hypothetical protein AWB65_05458 [Caballeronia humi]|uniref:Uncharacterized protein n=1 Tax=Caballeronia humi TaxID=326474 RepID=A0A158IVM5_9BURK|nr:hypothetical protein AWB65_05458 [Caballeronia humi]